jgi:hypothetical protein
MEASEIVIVTPVCMGECVAKRANAIVGEEAAASAGRARRRHVPLENLEAGLAEINEANVVLCDDLSANYCWRIWDRVG